MEKSPEKKKKTKHTFSSEGAAGYLRRLADQLENGTLQIVSEEMEFSGMVKVKESLKSKRGKISIKVGISLPSGEAEEEPQPAPVEAEAPAAAAGQEPGDQPDQGDQQQPPAETLPFKKLKKRMATGFKALGKALEAGEAPDQAAAMAFAHDCLLMTTYSGNGEQMYPAFADKAKRFQAAAKGGDPKKIKAAYEEIKAARKDCHSQFK